MEIKICGLCHPGDAGIAAEAGADYLGVVLAPGGPRSQSVDSAASIFAAAPGVRRVGVFVDATEAEIVEAGVRLGLDVVQLHGTEPPELIAALRTTKRWEIWKAMRPRDRDELIAGLSIYGEIADGILLDGWSARAAGGTGARFPWDEVAAVRDRVPAGVRLIVAGGLGPENVATAIARLAPDVVDVSSGVEAVIGRKAPERIRAFIAAAREAV